MAISSACGEFFTFLGMWIVTETLEYKMACQPCCSPCFSSSQFTVGPFPVSPLFGAVVHPGPAAGLKAEAVHPLAPIQGLQNPLALTRGHGPALALDHVPTLDHSPGRRGGWHLALSYWGGVLRITLFSWVTVDGGKEFPTLGTGQYSEVRSLFCLYLW